MEPPQQDDLLWWLLLVIFSNAFAVMWLWFANLLDDYLLWVIRG